MKLYHGTASYNLDSFKRSGAQVSTRHYIGGMKRAFCTTISFDVASAFAFRKTPMNDLNNCGIILEFDGSSLIKGKDYIKSKDPIAMRDEKEVSIFNPKKIKLIAYWKFENNDWVKTKV